MNRDAVGRRAEPFEMVVERSKIREMALATKCDHPAYLSDDPPLAPPTFFASMFGWMNPENDPWSFLDINPNRSVQVSQSYEFTEGPPTAGLQVTGQACVTSIERRTGRGGREADYVEIETNFVSGGRVVVRSRLTVAEFVGASSPVADQAPTGAHSLTGRSEEEALPAGASRHGPLTLTDFVRYEGASAHFNPIHFDPAVAEQAGLPAPIAVGMLLAGYMASHAVARYNPYDLRKITFAFKRRVWQGDCLAVTADAAEDEASIGLELTCFARGRGLAVSGSAVFVRPSEGRTND